MENGPKTSNKEFKEPCNSYGNPCRKSSCSFEHSLMSREEMANAKTPLEGGQIPSYRHGATRGCVTSVTSRLVKVTAAKTRSSVFMLLLTT